MRAIVVAWVLTAIAIEARAADDARVWVERAERARAAGNYEEALESMKRAHAADPHPKLLNNVAVLLEQLGRYREAYDAFEQVVAHPDTPAEVRQRDADRLSALDEKRRQAWIKIDAKVRILVDGQPHAAAESSIEPGTHTVHLVDGDRVWFERVYGVIGRRVDVKQPPKDQLGVVHLKCPSKIARAVVDRAVVPSAETRSVEVMLRRGEHDVRVDCDNGATTTERHDVQSAVIVVSPGPPVIRLDPVPPPAEASLAPWLIGGTGVALIGTSVALLVSARQRRALVLDTDGDGVGDVLFARAARNQDIANTRATWGAALLSVGIGGLVTGVIWYILD